MNPQDNDQLNEYLQPKDAPIAKPTDFVSNELIDRNYDYPAGKINYTHITPSSRIYAAIVSLSGEVGTFKDIQLALNYVGRIGGGSVFIKNGQYIVEKDLEIPRGVNIQGESTGATILDFNYTDHQLKGEGELIYNTGNISVNNNSTTVTGMNTVWDSSMIDSFIQIRGGYYHIVNVVSGTNITIETGFSGDNVISDSYAIVNPLFNVFIDSITVQNSIHSDGSIFFNYSSNINLTNYSLITSTLGFKAINSEIVILNNFNTYYCDSGMDFDNVSNTSLSSASIFNSITGNGITFNNVNTLSAFNFSVFNSLGVGIYMGNCYNYAVLDFSVISNTGAGIQLSNSFDGQILSGNFMNNTGDAIYLSFGNFRNIMSNLLIRNNGGYGINIVGGNTNNLIIGDIFTSNTLGDINNGGTTTKIRSCIGPSDN